MQAQSGVDCQTPFPALLLQACLAHWREPLGALRPTKSPWGRQATGRAKTSSSPKTDMWTFGSNAMADTAKDKEHHSVKSQIASKRRVITEEE
ncbi:MAG: hypothetical protein CMF26_02395 [Kiloniella sp.]|nr:hypothetical protein [Kiloniella sp.]